MPRYTVVAHRRVMKFLSSVGQEHIKERIKESVRKLADYPLSLKELDVEKLEGAEGTFRVRVGGYRLNFYVDKKERTIFVTHLGKRESIYQN